jgi:toxin FitB
LTGRYLLDTNVISEPSKARPDPRILDWLGRQADDRLFVATIVLGEIWQGVVALPESRRKTRLREWFQDGLRALFRNRVLPFDEAAALQWGELIAEGYRLGRPRSPVDMQIAAVALVHGCELVTANESDFLPVADRLGVINPIRP